MCLPPALLRKNVRGCQRCVLFPQVTKTSFEWFSSLLVSGSQEKVKLTCMIIWYIWRNRNEVLWDNRVQKPTSLLNLASSYLFQWTVAQEKFVNDNTSISEDGRICWYRPGTGWIKCNVDGAVFNQEAKLGYGWVIRDCAGSLVAAGCGSFAGHLDLEMAEAISCREALSWLKTSQAAKVILESDAFNLVQAIRGSNSFPSPLGLVIDDCKQLLLDIEDSRIYFVRRSTNSVAHSLTRASGFMSRSHVWKGSPPPFICNALMLDNQ